LSTPTTELREIHVRRTLAILLALCTVAGCGSSAASSAPGRTATAGAGASAAAAGSGSTAGSGAPSAHSTATTAECGGVGTYQGNTTRTFCGPARATVAIAGTSYDVAGGQCAFDATVGYYVNIGTIVLGAPTLPADAPTYFGAVQEVNGVPTVTGAVGGKRFTMIDGRGATVTFAADRKSGKASGNDITGTAVTAGFTCQG
jgi:hypothetical protein